MFAGTAGTVTLASPQSVTSLQFKTNGYDIAGSTLTLTAPTITTDSGVTATISSTIAGNQWPDQKRPRHAQLGICRHLQRQYDHQRRRTGDRQRVRSAQLPVRRRQHLQINNGATLRFNANNLTLSANRQVVMGAGAA